MFEMPHSTESEYAVIATAIVDKTARVEVMSSLNAADFFNESCRKLFEYIDRCERENKAVDDLTVYVESGVDPMDAGEIMTRVRYGDIKPIVEIIKERSQRRRLLELSTKIQDKVFNDTSAEEVLSSVQDELYNIANNRTAEYITQQQLITETIESLESRKGTDGITGVPSGFIDLDRMTAGWQPGHLIFLSAVPKMGKSAGGLHFAMNAGVPVLFFSLEMLPTEFADREFASTAEIDSHKIKSGNLGEEDWSKVMTAAAKLSEMKISWVDKSNLTVTEIKAIARKHQQEKGLGLIIIDQLDKIRLDRKSGESKVDAIGRVTSALKNMARDLRVPVIVLCQLLDKQVQGRPKPGDTRDSSYPDQDCDVMIQMWRPEFYYPKDTKYKNVAEFIIVRQRSGPTGSVWVRWEPKYTRFKNLIREAWPE